MRQKWKTETFDIYKDMIIFKGRDKTGEIESIVEDFINKRWDVKFVKSDKVYHCKYCDIIRFENPEKLNWGKEGIYNDEYPIYDPECFLKFGNKIRIVYRKGEYETVDSDKLILIKNGLEDKKVYETIEYLKDIAQYIVSCDKKTGEEYYDLKEKLSKFTYVHPDSVLYSYLTHGSINEERIDRDSIIYPFKFNLSQKVALENALSHSVSVIEGPPGTGKTQTILNIIANLITVQQKSVAIVSKNNDAVKNVKDKMSKEGYEFLIASLGRKDNQESFFANIPEIPFMEDWNCLEGSNELFGKIEILNAKLNDLLELEREKQRLEQELSQWKLEQEHFEKYYSKKVKKQEKIYLPLFCRTSDKILSLLTETATIEKSNLIIRCSYYLKLIFKYGKVGWGKPKQKLLITLQKEFYKGQIDKIERWIDLIDFRLEYSSFIELLEEYQRVSERIFRNYLYKSHNGLSSCDFGINNYKKDYKEFLKRYPIILSSTQSLRKSIPDNYLLDYVIIDEASQVDLITGIMVLSCCKNVIIVGDEKQLPHIVDRGIETKIKTTPISQEYNYFEENILSSIRNVYGEKLPCTTLLEHYRCHPKIIEFCNRQYYDGKLIPCTNPDISENPLILYRTSKGNHMRELKCGKEKGKYNQRELDVIKEEILNDLNIEDHGNVGVIAPFRLQADKATRELGENIECDTVHKYQGREKEIIIMTTVLDSSKSGQYGIDFVDEPHMINVAVSRAQKQFILDTDHDLFFNKGKEISSLIRYMQYNTLDDNIIESQVVSVFDLLYQEYSDKLLPLKKRMNPKAVWQSEEAMRVLLLDILKQKKYNSYVFTQNVLLCNLLENSHKLSQEELKYVDNGASLDFVIYDRMDMQCVLVIEVDGVTYHENSPKQQNKDIMKDAILNKYQIPYLRFRTNGSGERKKIENALDGIENKEQGVKGKI